MRACLNKRHQDSTEGYPPQTEFLLPPLVLLSKIMSVNMSELETLLQQYQGKYVPVAFNGGYVALSYVVSLVGAALTLELINRRTSRNGLFNHLLLVSAAVTMGGIAIWCMVSLILTIECDGTDWLRAFYR